MHRTKIILEQTMLYVDALVTIFVEPRSWNEIASDVG
jgi:hypothetical protein